MISNLRATTERNQEQDWLKTNLAKFTRMLQGQRDLITVGRCCSPNWRRWSTPSRASSTRWTPVEDKPVAAAAGRLCAIAADQPDRILRRRRAWSANARWKSSACCSTDVPADYTQINSGLGERRPASIVVLPVLFEGQTKAVIELASLQPFTATHLTFLEQLTAVHRHRAQHDRGDDAHRGPAAAVAAADRRTADAAEGTAADQRGTGHEGPPAGRAKRRSRAQEPGNRAGPPRARGKGRRTGADLQVQVRVPGQHVARAAHAAQLHPHPRPATGGQRRRQSHRQAGRIRAQHPLRRLRPAEPDQRHSRPVEDRVRHRHRRSRGSQLSPRSATPWNATSATSPSRRTCASHIEFDPNLPRASPPTPSGCSRFSRTCSPTPSSSPRRAASRCTCSWPPTAGAPDHPRAEPRRHVVSLAITDTGIGIAPEKQKIIFEAFQQADAGTQPQVRRHRPGPGHQPRAGHACWAAKSGWPARRARAARSRSTCR